MEQDNNYNKQFTDKGEMSLKSDEIKKREEEKAKKLEGAIEALAIMKGYKEIKK